jgi:hypothetical protein
MRILVACEESQALTNRFRKLGHEAFSCDILPCSGGHPEWHLQQAVTGNRWFNIDRYGEKAAQRHKDREEAIKFFLMFANADCEFIAIENPVGIMSSEWRKPDQIINPYEFGDPYEKKTCLWLKGLPTLKATNVVKPEPRKEFKSGKTMPGWYADAWKLPKDERAKLRSKTFPGIAQAITTQWTNFISEQSGRHDR